MIALETLRAQIGRRLPGGRFSVEPYEDWLMRDTVLAGHGDDPAAHPLWAFAGPQAAMGISIDELFTLCGAKASDGPMLGETDVELLAPLTVEKVYDVRATIVDVQRKSGARTGVFDIVTVEMEAATEGTPVARLRNSYVFPRRQA
ncbi:MAG TPA: hypothetical protein VHC18_21840 [Amycolatopsis sp.]|nr:hypothetical protein [Amycolatopsis sp.]